MIFSLLRLILRLIIPWIIKVLGWMLTLATTSLASIWVGVPMAVTRIAERWVEEANAIGFPERYNGYVYYPSVVVATSTLILGWVILAFITVFLIKLVF